jgi:phosphoglycerate kinase
VLGAAHHDWEKALMLRRFNTLDDLGDLTGKRALVGVDLNVPLKDGQVQDTTRLAAAKPTLLTLADKGAIVIILAHFDRPKGKVVPSMSLSPVVAPLAQILGRPVAFGQAASADAQPGSLILLENLRFDPGEEANDPAFVASLAQLGDLYVNDAFSAAHRAHASTEGLAHQLPTYAGRTMEAELKALAAALGTPKHPVVAVVGGAKVSSKLDVLRNLVSKVEHLIIGGGMANTFLAARGINVGKSLQEKDLYPTALAIFEAAEQAGCTIHLPYDVVVAKEFRENAPHRTSSIYDVEPDEMILDLGPAASEALADVVKICQTLVWNGPLGAFETKPFDQATLSLARSVAALTQSGSLLSVAGGGDTVAALNAAGVSNSLSFVSTAGGAFLEWMEGKELPGVKALYQG